MATRDSWSARGNYYFYLDALARPLTIVKSSSLGFSKEETITYSDNYSRWVLGQLGETKVAGQTVASATYDPQTALMQTFSAYGSQVQSLGYDAVTGTLTSLTDANGRVTSFLQRYRGIPQLMEFPGGSFASAVVNYEGRIEKITNEAGKITQYKYYPSGELQRIIYHRDPDELWDDYTVELLRLPAANALGISQGQWRQRHIRGNYRKDVYLDALMRPTLVHEWSNAEPAVNRYVQTSYDLLNRVQFQSYPKSTLPSPISLHPGIETRYDTLGREVERLADNELSSTPLTTRIEYLSGFIRKVKDPNLGETQYRFEVYDDPDAAKIVRVVAPESQTTDITRNIFGNVTEIARSGFLNGVPTTISRRYAYDERQRLCKRWAPETSAEIIQYDAAGQITWTASGQPAGNLSFCNRDLVAASDKVERTYHARGWVEEVRFPDSPHDIFYGYRADGALTSARRGTHLWTYGYTGLGTLKSESLSGVQGIGPRGFTYAHDTMGNVSQITYPDGSQVDLNPNGLGQATTVGSYLSNIAYNSDGSLHTADMGNGIAVERALNTRLLPEVLRYTLGTQDALHLEYIYDGNANVDRISDFGAGRHSQDFGYDLLNRLTSAQAPNSYIVANFQYDAFDNITQSTLENRILTFTYNTLNRLQTISGTHGVTTYDYYGNGSVNSASVPGATILTTFDKADTVSRVAVNLPVNSLIETYLYDANGHRTQITSGLNIRRPLYTRDGLLRAEYGPAHTDYYYYHGTQLVARRRVSTLGAPMGTIWYLTDHLGSNLATTSDTGVELEYSRFSPYGERFSKSVEIGPGFAGHIEDATSMTYMKARYYGGITGRFISPDPVGVNVEDGSNFNRYWYANNNPVKYLDPDGRNAVTFVGGLIYETGQFLSGNGFDSSNLGGALRDGYDGGLWSATKSAGEDVLTFVPAGLAVKALRVGKNAIQATRAVKAADVSRELRAADLGIEGTVKELRGTFTVTDRIATMRVDMIRGEIKNPLQVVRNMADTAKANGATTLRIEGTIANERLYGVLQRRYGLTSDGATDIITISLK